MEEELQEALTKQAGCRAPQPRVTGARQLLCRQLRQGSCLQFERKRVGIERGLASQLLPTRMHEAMQLCESAHGSSELTQSEHGASAMEGLKT